MFFWSISSQFLGLFEQFGDIEALCSVRRTHCLMLFWLRGDPINVELVVGSEESVFDIFGYSISGFFLSQDIFYCSVNCQQKAGPVPLVWRCLDEDVQLRTGQGIASHATRSPPRWLSKWSTQRSNLKCLGSKRWIPGSPNHWVSTCFHLNPGFPLKEMMGCGWVLGGPKVSKALAPVIPAEPQALMNCDEASKYWGTLLSEKPRCQELPLYKQEIALAGRMFAINSLFFPCLRQAVR